MVHMSDLHFDRIDPPYPPVSAIIARLREVFGMEHAVGPTMLRWWIDGDAKATGVAVLIDTITPPYDKPSVVWVARPGEAQSERCPIVTLDHLETFLANVSIARHSAAPVHGNVCPGEDR